MQILYTMRYRLFAVLCGVLMGLSASAQRVAQIFRNDGVCLTVPTESLDTLRMSTDGQRVRFVVGGTAHELDAVAVDSVTFGTGQSEVLVNYTANGPKVVNPYAFRGVDITVQDGVVRVTNNRSDELTYRLSGSGVGGFKLYSGKKQILVLDGLNLTAKNGAAINVQSKKKTTINLPAGTKNTLTDVASYTMEGEEDQKAALFAEGQLVFQGEGDLEVKGLYKHAVCSDDYISVEGGNITVSQAAGDGIHTNDYFRMTAGVVNVSNTVGDCIDGGEGYVEISGGRLDLTASTADTKVLKCDSVMNIAGGEMQIRLTGNQTKGLKSGRTMSLTGGRLNFTCSGGVVVTDGDPSYCLAIKGDGHIVIDGAYIDIVHSGTAGKGISADSTLTVISGEVNIALSGAGGTYTNASNTSDKYTATGLKADGDMFLQGGTLTLSASGSGGKCVSADGVLTIGDAEHSPIINASTTGSQVGSSSTGGNTGNRPGGNRPGGGGGWPGSSSSGSGGNPKCIKADGNVYIENGEITVSTVSEGGEGIESKKILTVNGGTIIGNTYDDVLQASNGIVINGGNIYAYASNNDGIDSNGTMTITGGVIFSTGTNQPEEGFDCDQNTFKITGGLLVGMGGATSTPTSSACTQRVVVYSGSVTQNTRLSVCNSSDGSCVFSVVAPRTLNSLTMVFSSPDLKASTGYTIYSEGSYSGGTEFKGLSWGGSYTPGTSKKTFTTSSMVTTVR